MSGIGWLVRGSVLAGMLVLGAVTACGDVLALAPVPGADAGVPLDAAFTTGDAGGLDGGVGSDGSTDLDSGSSRTDAAPGIEGCLSGNHEQDGGCDPLVFVTQQTYPSAIEGSDAAPGLALAAAQTACQDETHLTDRAFEVWLSFTTGSARARLLTLPQTRPLYLPSGTRVADGLMDIFASGMLLAPIDEYFTGMPAGGGGDTIVWTGSTMIGDTFTGQNCTDWTGSGSGRVGNLASDGFDWSSSSSVQCHDAVPFQAHFYCIEIVQ